MTFTNVHLKSSIGEVSNFFKNSTNPPEDMYVDLLLELKVSNLLMPVLFDGKNLSYPHIEIDDGTKLLPLFTSKEELKRYSPDLESIFNEFAYYIELVKDSGIDGIIIDIQSDEFCIERPLLEKISIPEMPDPKEGLEPYKLRDIALNGSNDLLKAFVENDDNFNKSDEAAEIMANTTLLNVVVSEEELDGYAKDGIISREDAGTFTLYTHQVGREHYGAVYTDIDTIVEFHEKLDYHYYAQITNKYTVFNFILSSDMEGIVVNPGTDEFIVSRKALLRIFNEDLINKDLAGATAYAFPIRS